MELVYIAKTFADDIVLTIGNLKEGSQKHNKNGTSDDKLTQRNRIKQIEMVTKLK